MKTLLFLITAVSALLVGCSQSQDDNMSTPPASSPAATNSASTNANTNASTTATHQ